MRVEVELEDLETIVFATAALKTIEAALRSRREDPFVKPHLEFGTAHNNLVAAMNGARRSAAADTATLWDGTLSKKELELLEQFIKSPVLQIDGTFRTEHDEVDSLVSKGCLRMGQLVQGAVWPGESRPDIQAVPGFALTITQRGKEKLANETKS